MNDQRRACGGDGGVFETSHRTKETRHKTHKTHETRQDTRNKTQDTRDNTCETRHATRHVRAEWEEGTARREKGRKSALKRRKVRACPHKGLKKTRFNHEKCIHVCMSGLMSGKTDIKQGETDICPGNTKTKNRNVRYTSGFLDVCHRNRIQNR